MLASNLILDPAAGGVLNETVAVAGTSRLPTPHALSPSFSSFAQKGNPLWFNAGATPGCGMPPSDKTSFAGNEVAALMYVSLDTPAKPFSGSNKASANL